jgi:hypothetical protein
MNLDASPTRQQLRELLAPCDDTAGPHVLWVSRTGDVVLSRVPGEAALAVFQQAHREMQMRYEAFLAGNEYVGPEAAEDEEWVGRLFDSLLKEWRRAKGQPEVEYIALRRLEAA